MNIPEIRNHGLDIRGSVTILGDLPFERPATLFNGVSLNHCKIGAYSYISAKTNALLTTIGRYCSIGDNVRLGLTEHPVDHLLTSPIAYKQLFDWHQTYEPPDTWNEFQPVHIEHDVWIGAGATVLGGVRLGTGCIVAARAVVTRDVPPYTIVAGIPAKPIKMRFGDAVVERLLALRHWRYDLPRWWAKSGGSPSGSLTAETLANLEAAVGSGDIPLYDAKALTLKHQGGSWSVS